MDQLNFTTINHIARKNLGLSLSEYVIADYIYHLSNNPKSKDGWCFASKQTMADEFGFTRRGIIKIINRLVDLNIVYRQEETSYLKTTLEWYEQVYFSASNSVHKVHRGGAQSSQGGAQSSQGGAQSSHNNNTNNNTNNNNIQTIHSVSAETPNLNKIIGLFKDVNPAYKELFKNKSQREAVSTLCSLYGEESIQMVVGKLKEVIYKKFAPRITTPYTLLAKYGDLIAYINQEHDIDDKFGFTQV